MIKLIVATGLNGEIGKSNKLLWNIPEDLAYFKQQTEGCIVVMGRKTFTSLPFKGGLPNRRNYVLSRYVYREFDNVTFLRGAGDFYKYCLDTTSEDVWLIGGSSVYEQFKDLAQEIHWTKVDKEFPDADTFMDMSFVKNALQWEKVSVKELTDSVNVVVYRKL